MIITYKPSDGDVQRFEFDPLKVLDDDAEEIEYEYKGTYDEFRVGVVKGQTRARRVLLWHLQRQVHPSLAFADLPRFQIGELEVEFDRDELLAMRQQTLDATLSPADRDAALNYIDTELAKYIKPEDVAQAAKDARGKASASPRGATTTRSRSASTSASRPSSKEG